MIEDNVIKKEIQEVCREDVFSTRIYKDLENLKVVLLNHTNNPYKSIVEMALETWGLPMIKWNKLSPKTRFFVVKEVLERRALPLALESVKFTFYIEGVTRHCFDQIARARVGVVFASSGTKDNNKVGADFIVPHILDERDEELLKNFYLVSKVLYKYLREKYPGWAARYCLPIGIAHNFIMSIDFLALQQLCSNRMETTEQVDTVALAWMLRERVREKFPLLGEYLRPQCDWIRRDRTVDVNGFASILGLPHNTDGRWGGEARKEELKKMYKVHNDSPCTDIKYIEKVLKIKIPSPSEWRDYTWEDLDERDRRLFEEV